MSNENERLLELIGQGDTLQALNLLYASGGDGEPGFALNRALYGPVSDAHDDAVRAAEQAHRGGLAGRSPEERIATLYNLGCFALMQDDVMDARLRFSEVLELDPAHRMARHNLAYAHELLAESEDAEREYRAVLARYPDSGLTRLNLAQLHMQQGDYEAGLEALEALHADAPDNLGVLLYLSRGLLTRGSAPDLARVLQLLEQAPDAESYVDLQECGAYARYLQGHLDEAEHAFRQLLEGGPDNRFALTGLIKVLAQRGAFAELKPIVERYHALAPSEATTALLTDLAEA
jgi:tetratricopeptide (TPR) repeat protein